MRFHTLLLLFSCSIFFTSCQETGKYELIQNGIKVKSNGQEIQIQFHKDNIAHITKKITKEKITHASLIVIDKATDTIDFTVKQKENIISLSTKVLNLNFDLTTGLISYLNEEGVTLSSESASELLADSIMGEAVYNIKQSFALSNTEGLYGLGQHQDGSMNYRTKKIRLIQSNTVAVIPFITSTAGYGILWDNYSETYFDNEINTKELAITSEVADQIDYYFIASDKADEVISGYRTLTGKAPMYGKWAYGYWQCKERYMDQADLLMHAKKFRDLQFPCDNIVQDWMYWGDLGWSAIEFDKKVFPDAKAAMTTLHDQNFHVMISIWPILGVDSKIQKEMAEKNLLFPKVSPDDKNAMIYDAFNPEARDLYWKYVKNNLFDIGIDAFWMDGTEPEFLNPEDQDEVKHYLYSLGNTHYGTWARSLNAYSIMTNSAVYEGQRATTDDKRVFILTRSSFAGQQRVAAATWSGDIDATWKVFRDQISSGINFCMAGVPYWTTDIGGFNTEAYRHEWSGPYYIQGIKSSAYKELYTRWFQYATFCPLFRSHGRHLAREPWQFGQPGSREYNTLLKYTNLRYRIMPYIYSLAWKVTDKDYTMMRGLPMDFPKDPNTFDIDNQFMFGDAFLVCPVTENKYFRERADTTARRLVPNEAKNMNVYLPAGQWFDFWTGKRIEGGLVHEAKADWATMPLFVRAGSIIPMGDFVQYVDEKSSDTLEIRIYPGEDASFTLYEDEGDNYNYENGAYSTITFDWKEENKTLSIQNRIGNFKGMSPQRVFNIILVNNKKGKGIAITKRPNKELNYDGTAISAVLE